MHKKPKWRPVSPKHMLSLHDYYRRPAVRQRMVEFLGGLQLEDATCVYLTADGRGSMAAVQDRES